MQIKTVIKTFNVMDIISRLNQFLTYTGLTSSAFAEAINIPKPSLSQILNGRNKKLSNEFIEKIHFAFPKLNIMWLLFNSGNMIEDEETNKENGNDLSNNGVRKEESTYPNIFSEANVLHNFTHKNTTSEPVPLFDYKKDHTPSNKFHASNTTRNSDTPHPSRTNPEHAISMNTIPPKRITSIIVYYDDSTFETFKCSEN